jgi:hypothetical protein
MRSGHLGRGAWLAWMILCTCLCVTSVHAQSPVVCAAFDDAELLARIRGQTRDLPISLISATADLSHPTATQLQAIARERAADFVVSVDQDPNGSRTVYVFDARAEELRVRTAPAPDRKHRFARSAAAETVALIVRGELSDALAARASQQAQAAQAAKEIAQTPPPPARAPAASTPSNTTSQPITRPTSKPAEKPAQNEARAEELTEQASEPEPEPEPDNTTSSISLGPPQLSLELAARASTPIDTRYFLGAALHLRLSFDYFSVGVTGSTTLADRAEIQGLALTLREHGVGIDALAHLPLTAAFRVGLGATGRWLFYRRSAESGRSEWTPEPADTTSTFAIGPQAELRWQFAQHLGMSVRIGLDVLLRPVSWNYRLDTNARVPIELERQNRTEPWVSVGVYGSM